MSDILLISGVKKRRYDYEENPKYCVYDSHYISNVMTVFLLHKKSGRFTTTALLTCF